MYIVYLIDTFDKFTSLISNFCVIKWFRLYFHFFEIVGTYYTTGLQFYKKIIFNNNYNYVIFKKKYFYEW